MKTADKLGDVIKKAMVWEIWDKIDRKIIWFIRETPALFSASTKTVSA